MLVDHPSNRHIGTKMLCQGTVGMHVVETFQSLDPLVDMLFRHVCVDMCVWTCVCGHVCVDMCVWTCVCVDCVCGHVCVDMCV